jgi:hypothetical protein
VLRVTSQTVDKHEPVVAVILQTYVSRPSHDVLLVWCLFWYIHDSVLLSFCSCHRYEASNAYMFTVTSVNFPIRACFGILS